MKNNKNRYLIFILLLLISLGFAYLSTELLVKGDSIIHGNKWLIYWDDVNVIDGSVTTIKPTIEDNTTSVSYDINLSKPGDYYDFSVEAVNGGTIDAMISLITITYEENNTSVVLPDCLKFSIKYGNGTDVSVSDLLKENSREKYYINIEYDRDVSIDTMISTDRTFNIIVNIQYEQADNTANEVIVNSETVCLNNRHQEVLSSTVCKRATNLHTEKCISEGNPPCNNAYKGKNIIYGTCGSKENLSSGDAFDCDVDGNGSFDDDERFYYVSLRDVDESSKYATLIYYKDYANTYYNENNKNTKGPTGLVNELPSIEDWPNVRLYSEKRQIRNELGGTTYGSTKLPIFSYTNRAARLLTYQEAVYACGDESQINTVSYLDNCVYLQESPYFSSKEGSLWWWLETPISENSARVYDVYIGQSRLGTVGTVAELGVRPAIEVPLKNIAY